MARAHRPQQRQGQTRRGGTRRQAHSHRTGDAAPGSVHVDARLVALAQDQLRMPVQHLAGLGRRDAALCAQQQLLAHFAFQRRQLLAQGGLGNVQQIGGLSQAADVDDLDEVFQAPEIQPLVLRVNRLEVYA